MNASYYGNKRTATIDDDTALWAARMLEGEGYKNGKGCAVLWATLYRYLGMPHEWKSYKIMIQRFSSPINERLLPGGDLYEQHKNSKNAAWKQATSDSAVKRRKRIIALPWNQIHDEAKTIVKQFQLGQLLPPTKFGDLKFSNFASYDGLKEKYPDGIDIGGDWFFVDPALKTDWEISIGAQDDTDDDTEKKN